MLPGVYSAKRKNGILYYRASITFQGKHISLGSFPDEAQAHSAYLEASELLTDPSFRQPEELTATTALPFYKKISLLNFRSHQIYFKNPIYLKKNYFLYYLSPSYELKFDIDDLFYYADHKIIRRQGHLYVNDYGMQISLLSRYGVKSYGVAGRDYLFANGDETDFRYSNILVINPYYGVFRVEKKNGPAFQVKLHIKGDLTVGTYPKEEIAAIAYNKAVDLAKKHGVNKNFRQNYLVDYSPKEYAKEYLEIKFSDNFLKYFENCAIIKSHDKSVRL